MGQIKRLLGALKIRDILRLKMSKTPGLISFTKRLCTTQMTIHSRCGQLAIQTGRTFGQAKPPPNTGSLHAHVTQPLEVVQSI
ncbi:hypothetical protein E2P81_ATG11863 [Venturia nashicola]|nr:hypothetical protein E2P81_ATG11863 [Venturia nashicola]